MDVNEIRTRNVAWLVEQAGGPTAFGEKVDRSQTQVSQWLGGKSIGRALARHIDEKLGRPAGWLDAPRWPGAYKVSEPLQAYDVRPVDGNDGLEPDRDVLIEEVDVQLSGGPGTWAPEFVETKVRTPYQVNWFKKMGAKPEAVKLMRVNGYSMERTLYDGDRVAVNLGDRRVVNGRVYALFAGGDEGGARIKRLYMTADGKLRIVSDNADKVEYPDEFVGGEDLESVYIIGRVIDKGGSGGL